MSAHEPATFFYVFAHKFAKKVIFLVKRCVPENFQRENFSGPAPTESLRTQDSEHMVGLGDRASFSKLQQLIVRSLEKIGHIKRKIRGVKIKDTPPIFVQLNWQRLLGLNSMLIQFPSNRTKIGGVPLIFDTANGWGQILKRGSTSAGRNSALKTPYTALPYIF